MTHEILAARTVYFEETGEAREVVRDCQRCFAGAVSLGVGGTGTGVVSPSGIAHIAEYETTLCGHDATGDRWWWPL